MKYGLIAGLLLLLFTNMAYGQAQFVPVILAFPQIAVGGESSGQNYVTLIQIVNNNSAATTARLELFGDSGATLSVLFDGDGPKSTIDIPLASGETRQLQLTLNGAITTGWLKVSYTPSDALTTVILQFRSGTTLLSEVGVDPAFDTILATDFSAETDATLNTGIAVANPSSANAYALARLSDPGTGATLANTILALAPNGHVARLLTEIFPSVLNIAQIRAKVSLDSCGNSACTLAGGDGVLATAIRLNGDQFTTIPVADRPSGGEQTRIMPQVAFGGPAAGLNMKTVLYFTTNISTGTFGTADIFDNDGNPLKASADGASPSSSITFTVPGNRVSRVVLSGDETLRSGWIRLTLSGSVHLVASAVFQTFTGANLVSEASVLESPAIKHGLIYVKVKSGASNVGVAFANSQADPNTITLDLFSRDGFVLARRDITLPANGHLAQFVTEIFPQLASQTDFDGALSIHSTVSFSALALRLSSDKLATLPVSANGMYRPSITGLRITRTQRSPAQVNFELDLADFDKDIATSSSTSVSGIAEVDFGSSGAATDLITIDGTSLLDRATGTLSGIFQPRVSGTIPSGFSAAFYIVIYDAGGNQSNVVAIPFRF